MRVIVAGAGEIGWYLAEEISRHGHDATLIDSASHVARQAESGLDVRVLHGSAASVATLLKAGVAETDLFVAVTGNDDTNLVCASLARKLGAVQTVARVDEVVYRKAPEISYREHFGIDELVSPEMLAALELAAIVRNPGALAVEHFARGRLEMQQLLADRRAQLVGKQLHEMALPEGVRLASLKRGDQISIPAAYDRVEHGDRITIVGETEQVARCRASFEAGKSQVRRVTVMGGGHTTLSLVRRLPVPRFRVTVIERDAERCEYLAAAMSRATILHGDGTKLAFLKEERIESADVFISTTASDEANIMSAVQAKDLGVPQVLVVIHRPDYAGLVEKMGIDRAISPRVVMVREMLGLLGRGKMSTLARVEDGTIEILQLAVEGEDFVGRRLCDLALPGGALVLTLQRGREVLVPHANTEFQLGDTVLVICRDEHRKELVRLIVGSA